ncbi:hypothetical protein HK405_008418, partial [Cladochytrium tenue]
MPIEPKYASEYVPRTVALVRNGSKEVFVADSMRDVYAEFFALAAEAFVAANGRVMEH